MSVQEPLIRDVRELHGICKVAEAVIEEDPYKIVKTCMACLLVYKSWPEASANRAFSDRIEIGINQLKTPLTPSLLMGILAKAYSDGLDLPDKTTKSCRVLYYLNVLSLGCAVEILHSQGNLNFTMPLREKVESEKIIRNMLRIILYETQKELPKEPSTNPVKFLEEFLKSNIRDAVIGIGHEIDQEIAEWQRNIRGASALSKGVYILSKLPGITPGGFLVSLILSEGAEAGHQAALKLQQLGKSYSYIVRRFYQPTSELNIPRPSF